jgi:chromosome segregation ATPase
MNKIALVTILGAVLAGCGQQTTADLAVCKADLTRAQTEIQAAKDAQTAAESKVVATEQAQAALQAKLTELESAATAAAAKVGAAKSKVTAYQQSVKKAAAEADVKNAPSTTPVKQMTQEQKNKALGF